MADVDEDVLEAIKERFEIFDRKGDKKIESSQVLDVLRSCGLNPLTEDVARIVKESDLTGKRVDVQTFAAIYHQIETAPGVATFEDMVEALRAFDRDRTGLVTAAELRQVLINLGDKLTAEQADAIVTPHEDDKGYIQYTQMIKTIMASGREDSDL